MLRLEKPQQRLFILLSIIIILMAGILIYKEIIARQNHIQELLSGDPSISNGDPEDGASEGQIPPGDPDKSIKKMIKVYITGQIKYPGVVELEEGSRLEDAINAAGGMLSDADPYRINPAVRVKDEEMYIIPKVGEALPHDLYTNPYSEDSSKDSAKININTADQSLLETLPAIGVVRAQGIISYREKNGPFQSIEEIKKVQGIGDKIFEGLKDFISVR